jgi:hypothetical protein
MESTDKDVGIVVDRISEIVCQGCGCEVDVSELDPFTEIECPQCGHDDVVPARLGPFRLLRLIGTGGMGGVYYAADESLGRFVAIKVMLRSLGEDADFVETFKREAQAAARLNHPNIAQIYSFGQEKGQPYIVMELVPGQGLDRLIDADHPLDQGLAMKIGLDIAEGLRAADEAGLVHGDIKPENILLDDRMKAKLVDFGLATFAHQKGADAIWGTPYYISPEKIRRMRADARSDIYSLGATLYHALAGRPPFEGETPIEVVKARLDAPAQLLGAVRTDIDPDIERIIARMMEIDPSMRYPTYVSLISDMRKVVARLVPASVDSKSRKMVIRKRSTNRLAVPDAGAASALDHYKQQSAGLKPQRDPEEAARRRRRVARAFGWILLLAVLATGAVGGWYVWKTRRERVWEARREALALAAAKTDAQAAFAGLEVVATNMNRLRAGVGPLREQATNAYAVVEQKPFEWTPPQPAPARPAEPAAAPKPAAPPAAPEALSAQGFEDSAQDTWTYSIAANGASAVVAPDAAASGKSSLRMSGSQRLGSDPTVEFANVGIEGFTNALLSLAYGASGPDQGDDLYLDISYDNGATWNGEGSCRVAAGRNNLRFKFGETVAGPNPCVVRLPPGKTQVRIRVRFDENGEKDNRDDVYFVDDVRLTAVRRPAVEEPKTNAPPPPAPEPVPADAPEEGPEILVLAVQVFRNTEQVVEKAAAVSALMATAATNRTQAAAATNSAAARQKVTELAGQLVTASNHYAAAAAAMGKAGIALKKAVEIRTRVAKEREQARVRAEEEARAQADAQARQEAEARHRAQVDEEKGKVVAVRTENMAAIQQYRYREAREAAEAALAQLQTDEGKAAMQVVVDRYRRIEGLKQFLVRTVSARPFRWGWLGQKDIVAADDRTIGITGTRVPWAQVPHPVFMKWVDHYLADPAVKTRDLSELSLAAAVLLYELGKEDAVERYRNRCLEVTPQAEAEVKRLLPVP